MKKVLLYVESERNLRELLHSILLDFDLEVITARSMERVLEALKTEKFIALFVNPFPKRYSSGNGRRHNPYIGFTDEQVSESISLFNKICNYAEVYKVFISGEYNKLDRLISEGLIENAVAIRKDSNVGSEIKEILFNRFGLIERQSFSGSVFISYAREDIEVAQKIWKHLVMNGFLVWMDVVDLLAGQDWEHEIEEAITSSSVFLACLSTKSVTKTGYVQRELKLALKALDLLPEGSIYIVPVQLNEVPIPRRFRHIHCVDISAKNGLEHLTRALCVALSERSEEQQVGGSPWCAGQNRRETVSESLIR